MQKEGFQSKKLAIEIFPVIAWSFPKGTQELLDMWVVSLIFWVTDWTLDSFGLEKQRQLSVMQQINCVMKIIFEKFAYIFG